MSFRLSETAMGFRSQMGTIGKALRKHDLVGSWLKAEKHLLPARITMSDRFANRIIPEIGRENT